MGNFQICGNKECIPVYSFYEQSVHINSISLQFIFFWVAKVKWLFSSSDGKVEVDHVFQYIQGFLFAWMTGLVEWNGVWFVWSQIPVAKIKLWLFPLAKDKSRSRSLSPFRKLFSRKRDRGRSKTDEIVLQGTESSVLHTLLMLPDDYLLYIYISINT